MTVPFLIKARKNQRKKTRIRVTVRYGRQGTPGQVIDLSAAGLALSLEGPLYAATGSRIRIESEELGLIDGTVQWCSGNRLGLEFDPSSNAYAKIASYFRFYHREPGGADKYVRPPRPSIPVARPSTQPDRQNRS